jgi:hypothetical protein
MMPANIRLLDVVALASDVPEQSLLRGQVGTVVEVLGPGRYEVEFADDEGHAYAEAAFRDDQLIVLHYSPQQAAE